MSEVTQQLGHWTTVDPQARANQERLGLGQRVTALVLTPSRELRLQVLIIPAPGNSSQRNPRVATSLFTPAFCGNRGTRALPWT
ncbi:hypothetical protein QTO34_007630 [Cnephaeus nilssonii]|uniref:Uncharacterized protein n=1 Tax=Cnephaeus nilssonii TaxID=3371016 RepID=A0AA40HIP6_CNENI|nr:hypothetical protein QTO34_007630 [Eptesicus nilssonii]